MEDGEDEIDEMQADEGECGESEIDEMEDGESEVDEMEDEKQTNKSDVKEIKKYDLIEALENKIEPDGLFKHTTYNKE